MGGVGAFEQTLGCCFPMLNHSPILGLLVMLTCAKRALQHVPNAHCNRCNITAFEQNHHCNMRCLRIQAPRHLVMPGTSTGG